MHRDGLEVTEEGIGTFSSIGEPRMRVARCRNIARRDMILDAAINWCAIASFFIWGVQFTTRPLEKLGPANRPSRPLCCPITRITRPPSAILLALSSPSISATSEFHLTHHIISPFQKVPNRTLPSISHPSLHPTNPLQALSDPLQSVSTVPSTLVVVTAP